MEDAETRADATGAETGRARVRARLLAPLEALELRQPRGVTGAEAARRREALVDRLSYMDGDALDALAEQVRVLAGGPWKSEWPGVAVVLALAERLQKPAPEDDRMVASYMRSAAGRRAWEEGELVAVALVGHLVRVRLAPTESDWRRMRVAAGQDASALGSARLREAQGRADDGDRALIATSAARIDRARAMVFAAPPGQARLSEDAA